MNIYSLQREDDGEGGQQHHGEQAVAEDAHDLAARHPRHAHEVEEGVHGQRAHHAKPVDVAELHLASLGKG
jgi:hypothetical protein